MMRENRFEKIILQLIDTLASIYHRNCNQNFRGLGRFINSKCSSNLIPWNSFKMSRVPIETQTELFCQILSHSNGHATAISVSTTHWTVR